jgi:hypothetical protein
VGQTRIVGSLAALAVILSVVTAGPALAQGGSAADCLISVPVHLSPAVSMVPTSGTETSGGETGSIACTGTFDGQRVTGPGPFGYEGTFTGITCLFDSAPLSGRYSFTVPTDAGSLHFIGTITDARIAVIDRFDLSQSGAHLTGSAAVVPINGTCLITPTTDILITILGSFRPAPAGTPVFPNPTVTNPSATVPTQVLGAKLSRPPALPVTGPTNLGVLGVLAMVCYLIGGVALSSSRKHRSARSRP